MTRDRMFHCGRLSGGFAVVLAAGLWGCAPRSAPTVAVVPVPMRAARTSTGTLAAGSVGTLPEYQQAREDCARGQFKQAADVLARLKNSRTLSAEQRAFVQAQEEICRSHLTPDTGKASARLHIHSATSPVTRQDGAVAASDCGPRALLLACRDLGVAASLPDLCRAAGTGPKGTSLGGLKRAAEGLHLRAEGVQASREALPDLPVPAIAWSHGDHFITVLALQGRGESGTATVHDPNEAQPRTVSQETLLQACSGYLLTLRR